MAFDNMSFMEKLRMNNVFPAEGQGLPHPLIGMPDFTYGQNFGNGGGGGGGNGIGRIAASQAAPYRPNTIEEVMGTNRSRHEEQYNPSLTKPMGTAWEPGAADINAGRMVLGETPKDKQEKALQLAVPKNAVAIGNLDIKARAQALKEKVESGKATDAEKQEYAKEILGIKNEDKLEQIDRSGAIGSRQIGERGVEQRLNTELSGNQAMDRLGKSITSREGIAAAGNASREGIAASKNSGMLPTQQNSDQENRARQLLVSNPAMAQFVQIEPNGQFSIVGNPPLDVLSQIQKSIYGNPKNAIAKDEELPADNKTSIMSGYGSKTPTSKTPTANDPLGIR